MLYALDGGSEGKFICEVHVIQQVLYPVGDNKTSNRMMLILLLGIKTGLRYWLLFYPLPSDELLYLLSLRYICQVCATPIIRVILL